MDQTMRMPDAVYATMAAVVQKFPHTGTDDERRAAMEKAVATLRARHGLRWVWKTEHQSLIAPSKDGLGYVAEGEIVHGRLTSMFIWDTISGGTRQLNAAPLISEAERMAYVLAVEPKDWLDTQPPPPPPVHDDVDLAPVMDALTALRMQVGALQTAITALTNRPVVFPDYTTRLLGQTVTLSPRK